GHLEAAAALEGLVVEEELDETLEPTPRLRGEAPDQRHATLDLLPPGRWERRLTQPAPTSPDPGEPGPHAAPYRRGRGRARRRRSGGDPPHRVRAGACPPR